LLQQIDYYDIFGKKVGDEHTTWEWEATGQENDVKKFRCKEMNKTYTDKDGNPIKTIITQGSQVIELTYDDNGRIVKEVYKIPVFPGIKEVTYEYEDTFTIISYRIKKRTDTFVDNDGKLIGKRVCEDYEYDDSKLKKATARYYDKSGKLIGKETWEYEYEGKKIKKLKITEYDVTDGEEALKQTKEFTYNYQRGKTIEELVVKDKDGNVIRRSEREIKKTRQKAKIVWPGMDDNSTKSMEYRFDSDFPNFTEPTAFLGKIVISDFGTNPTIPPVGTYTVMISIDNSTGSYDEIFYVVGNSLDFNMTLSMNTTITIMVIDEAGHIGVNTIQIPLPLASDIDCNKKVDIIDISTAAIAFGTQPGNERWNFFADVNNDNVVNILDISTVALDFGKTY